MRFSKLFLPILFMLPAVHIYGQSQEETDFNQAVDLLKDGKFKYAITKFSAIIPKTENKALKKMCYIYRGFSYNEISDYKNAIASFDSAIIIDPDDVATYIDRGKTQGYIKEKEAAKKDFEYVLTKDSTSEQAQAALYYLGLIAYQQGNDKESIGYYDRLIRLAPNDAEAYFNRGCAKGRTLKDIEGSIKDYDKAIELEPDYAAAYANRGVAKINLLTTGGTIQPSKDQTKDACADLKKAKSLGDNSVDDMIYVYCDKK